MRKTGGSVYYVMSQSSSVRCLQKVIQHGCAPRSLNSKQNSTSVEYIYIIHALPTTLHFSTCLEQPASSHGVKPCNVAYCHWCTRTDLLWRHWWSDVCPPPGPRDLHLWPSWWRRHRCWYPPRPPLWQQEVVTPWRWTQTALTFAWVWLEDEAPDVARADYTWTFTLGQFWGRKEREREKGQFLENAAPLRWKLNHGYLVTYLVLGFFTSNRSHSVTSGRIAQSKLISISSNHKSLHHRFV